MKYKKLNIDWNADPNDPDPKVTVKSQSIELKFYLNYFIYNQFKEGEKGKLIFKRPLTYRLGSPGDEGYYMGEFRYSNSQLPWGEFYILKDSDWKNELPDDKIKVSNIIPTLAYKHYIFFLRDNTFECISTGYKFEIH